MIVFVSGPLTARTYAAHLQNIRRAEEAAVALIQAGHTPVVPHHHYYTDWRARGAGISIGYERWLAMDLEILGRCDAICTLGCSPGADRELARARELGMPVLTPWDLEEER